MRPIRLDLLRRAGALDIAAMVGFILSAAQRKLLVIFDNAVTGSAVLIARALCPTIDDYVCASARYLEPVHQMQMKSWASSLLSKWTRTSTRAWVRPWD